jgi:hypothetical protein
MKHILCADLHIRDTVPVCRADDFFYVQKNKFAFLVEWAITKKANIFCAGDIFHNWKVSPEVITPMIQYLIRLKEHGLNFYTVYGQHDIPYHNKDEVKKSALYLLATADLVTPLEEGNWYNQDTISPISSIAIAHRFVYPAPHTMPYAIASAATDHQVAEWVDREYPDVRVIVCGDNHQGFRTYYPGSDIHVVVPGPMTRQATDQILSPKFYIYDDCVEGDEAIQWVHYPQEPLNNVMKEKVETITETGEDVAAFMENLRRTFTERFNVMDELMKYIESIDASEQIMNRLRRMIDEYNKTH